ncbi:unnamed protein product [Acanthoscelides obtectus]|uniref:Uncharacterized protein n=1 Tax=Acanthoscelides obtectus TaxID=200917 RepID=A0A9P0JY41_ACAOB|nr:unnamed protein product [Acanthoscelides obtectus]CAK1647114.1 hypothetical protein AOBTE_LOCUS15056 [Acanthoscelides obtectus]
MESCIINCLIARKPWVTEKIECYFRLFGQKMTSRSPVLRGKSASQRTPSSSIPLPVKFTAEKASVQSVAKSTASSKLSRPSTVVVRHQITPTGTSSKHTLEVQFINKKKRLAQLKKDLLEKQKPVLDLYQNLVQIKKKLEELGKHVQLEQVKLMNYDGDAPKHPESDGGGESISPEVIIGMQTSIEEIPRTLMEICKNLLGRRNVIVELLESVTKSEVDVGSLTEQIETLKQEGQQLQSHLDVVLSEHHSKIKEIVANWQTLLNDKDHVITNAKVGDLEEKLKSQENLTEEARHQIAELQKKLDDKRNGHDRYVAELNNVIHGLKDHIQKMEQELEAERKVATDFKSRNSSNAQTSKTLRNKVTELENDKKNTEALNSEINKKLKLLQDSIKHKEAAWIKEKDDLTKSLKHQENLLQKLTADKNSFETRLETMQDDRTNIQDRMQTIIDDLTGKLNQAEAQLEEVTKEKDEACERCREMEEHMSRLGIQNRDTMNAVSNSVNWGKEFPQVISEADKYNESMMKDIVLRELKDRVQDLEKENENYKQTIAVVEQMPQFPSETEKSVRVQHEVVLRYKQMLAESEAKLSDKSQEVARLTSEIRQLKVRQEHLEELNQKCPAENLQRMVEEGRNKLNEIMNRSLDSEQKILQCENIIEKQSKQINEMENLLRYRENMTGVLKASRDELIMEKESLTKYSQEMRSVLSEVTREGKMKDHLISELQKKIEVRERQISKLEKELHEVEANLVLTNEKRYKLQETVGAMEKELQATKAHVNQLADLDTRYDLEPSKATLDKLAFVNNMRTELRSIAQHKKTPSGSLTQLNSIQDVTPTKHINSSLRINKNCLGDINASLMHMTSIQESCIDLSSVSDLPRKSSTTCLRKHSATMTGDDDPIQNEINVTLRHLESIQEKMSMPEIPVRRTFCPEDRLDLSSVSEASPRNGTQNVPCLSDINASLTTADNLQKGYSSSRVLTCSFCPEECLDMSFATSTAPHRFPSSCSRKQGTRRKTSFHDVTTNCGESVAPKKLNSRSLIGLSLHHVNVIKTRLDHLSRISFSPMTGRESDKKLSSKRSCCSHSSLRPTIPNENLIKIVELSAKRYELLQKQAYESYEELTNLVKLAMSRQHIE